MMILPELPEFPGRQELLVRPGQRAPLQEDSVKEKLAGPYYEPGGGTTREELGVRR